MHDSIRFNRRLLPRRLVLKGFAALLGVPFVAGCKKTVTRYRPDGTPYTVEEDDWVSTLAATILLLLLVGAIAAAAANDDDSSSMLDPRRRRKSRLVSVDRSDYEFTLQPLAFSWSVEGRAAESRSALPQALELYSREGVRMARAQIDASRRVIHRDIENTDSLKKQIRGLGLIGMSEPVRIELRIDDDHPERISLLRMSRPQDEDHEGEESIHEVHGNQYSLWTDSDTKGVLSIVMKGADSER